MTKAVSWFLAPVLEGLGGGVRLRWYVLCLSLSAVPHPLGITGESHAMHFNTTETGLPSFRQLIVILNTYSIPGGCGQMYETIIVSSQFANKRSLQRHRAVNTALKQEIAAMHAWSAQCYTPEEWEKNKPQ
jgi:stress-induced morphogen